MNEGQRAALARALHTWRDSLVSGTRSNRLLAFNPRPTSAIAIASPTADQLLSRLAQGQDLSFRSLIPEEQADDVEWPPRPDPAIIDSEAELSVIRGALANLYRRAQSEYLDRGLHVLYLAIGLLHWQDEAKTEFLSPLLLVPVSLIRPGPGAPLRLEPSDEDVAINPVLALKLINWDVTLPEVADLESVDCSQVLQTCRRAVAAERGWLVTDEVYLSHFSFANESMYRDLLDNEAAVVESPILQALVGGGTAASFDFTPTSDDRIDDTVPPERTPLLMDADASQRACVEAALAGRSFVVEGPPGTGKSQTIANMIGALVAEGRSVLFVSEKAAALQVVRDRLAEVGLGDLLLELHSHKATRKQVATALGSALDATPFAPRGMSDIDRADVLRMRTELSAYAEAMNVVREPLGQRLHDVIGLVTSVNVLQAPCHRGRVLGLTSRDVASVRAAAESLSRAWRPGLQGESYLWRDVVDTEPLEGRIRRASRATESFQGLAAANSAVVEAFDLRLPQDAELLYTLAWDAQRRPAHVAVEWLVRPNLADLADAIRQLDTAHTTLANERTALQSATRTPTEAVPYAVLPDQVGRLAPGMTAESADELAAHAHAGARLGRDLLERSAALAKQIGSSRPRSIADVSQLLRVSALSSWPLRPERSWLDIAGIDWARTSTQVLRAAWSSVENSERSALQFFTPEAARHDIESLERRFRTDHHGLHGYLGSAARSDKKLISLLARPNVPLDVAVSSLRLVVEWQTAVARVAELELVHATCLGPGYEGRTTDFDGLLSTLDAVAETVAGAPGLDLRSAADCLCRDSTSALAVSTAHTALEENLRSYSGEILSLPAAASTDDLESTSWDLDAIAASARSMAEVLRAFDLALDRTTTVGEVVRLVSQREAIDRAEAALDRAARDASVVLGLTTDGATPTRPLQEAFLWVRDLRMRRDGTDRPLTAEQIAGLSRAMDWETIRSVYNEWRLAVDAVLNAFSPARRTELESEIRSLDDVAGLFAELESDLGGQAEWFAYLGARDQLRTHGLENTVEFCVSERVAASDLPATIEAALLRSWADGVIASEPALQNGRAEDRDALVAAFAELDRQLVATAARTIVESYRSRLPRSDIGQVAVIRREAGKKKKHMPVRTLLSRTREVSQAIKPCFMMSPLAVSQFLPPDFRFDVVIFDEASQIFPGEAINCIYRGGALITAGDSKQLPPTSFFGRSTGDDDEEWLPDGDEGVDYESILDLVSSCGAFRSLPLRWHYRSRHESLIAFSNRAFYEGRLITFPSADMDGPDVGVALVYVPDGEYRRGTSRDNPREAQVVAERVIHHFDTRPDRTLGVVTFSAAQEVAVETAVERARASRPDLDRYFDEDRLNGFFVKNLELVQGDERDVMIFSIGYGPDENRKTTLNLGPLNRSGGWRRLNVAITRARYRNEIVSSLTAADIPFTAGSEGVRQLGRYLDFAERGNAALALDVSEGGDAESPFEEAVIAAIRGWGYEVVPQVGVAGYRIDMGVKHPDRPGAYAIGIECDGAMYHSSRSARDRDRLRESILRGLGWELHRIWGTSWYRDRATELNRLRSAIEASFLRPVLGSLTIPTQQTPRLGRLEQLDLPTPDRSWSRPYELADVPPLPRWLQPGAPGASYDMERGVAAVVAVESPVHEDVLVQRLREAWGIGRMGPRVRDNIAAAMQHLGHARDGRFLLGSPVTYVRTPTDGIARTLDQIHHSELDLALHMLLDEAGGATEDELPRACARLFGWRVNDDLRRRVTDGVDRLVAGGSVARAGDLLRSTQPA